MRALLAIVVALALAASVEAGPKAERRRACQARCDVVACLAQAKVGRCVRRLRTRCRRLGPDVVCPLPTTTTIAQVEGTTTTTAGSVVIPSTTSTTLQGYVQLAVQGFRSLGAGVHCASRGAVDVELRSLNGATGVPAGFGGTWYFPGRICTVDEGLPVCDSAYVPAGGTVRCTVFFAVNPGGAPSGITIQHSPSGASATFARWRCPPSGPCELLDVYPIQSAPVAWDNR